MNNSLAPSLQSLIDSALQSINPYKLTVQHLRQHISNPSSFQHIYVIGFGKAAYLMGLATEKVFQGHITAGFINVPEIPQPNKLRKIKLQLASHPLPQQKNITASKKIVQLAKRATAKDLVVCLISGGGSSLLTLPTSPLTLSDIKQTFDLLIRRSPAAINEINVIRKHLSQVKGGRLAEICYPATVHSLIISDVINNDLSTISSGPTYPDTSTFADAWQIIKKYKLINKLPPRVKNYLYQGWQNKIPDTPTKQASVFKAKRVKNCLIADNHTALRAVARQAKKLKLKPIILSDFLQGEVRKCANDFISLLQTIKPNTCLIAGGETVIKVKGSGYGGRNQEFALQIIKQIPKRLLREIELVSFGSDGVDGFCPQKVAGAWVNYSAYQKMKQLKLKPTLFQQRNDSYTFFKKIKAQLITGPTGTNVGDIVIAIRHTNETEE